NQGDPVVDPAAGTSCQDLDRLVSNSGVGCGRVPANRQITNTMQSSGTQCGGLLRRRRQDRQRPEFAAWKKRTTRNNSHVGRPGSQQNARLRKPVRSGAVTQFFSSAGQFTITSSGAKSGS